MPLQATSGAASYDAFGGGVPFEPTYIEQIFSTWLYTGNGSTQTITNGIDLAGKGGLVWFKRRNADAFHQLYDTARGVQQTIYTNATNAQTSKPVGLTAFNANGFTVGSEAGVNGSGDSQVSWTFREQAKFFDVVTWTGDSSANRQISHSLGSVPGCMIIKQTSASGENWAVYHRSIGATGALYLNTTGSVVTADSFFNDTEPTSTNFTVSNTFAVNRTGFTYVAYLFAHNAGGFGLTGTDNVISCGSFTTDGSGAATVNLGYEPQWVMIKAASTTGSWIMNDNMRGMPASSNASQLFANLSNAENTNVGGTRTNATGFNTVSVGADTTFIYIAIRRGPMKVPTTGTSVFDISTVSTSSGPVPGPTPTDMTLNKPDYTSPNDWRANDRLRGNGLSLFPNTTNAESNENYVYFDFQSGLRLNSWPVSVAIWYNFKRAPGFFDEVCYTGNGTAGRTVTHNLTIAPELMIVKGRSDAGQWRVYSSALGATQAARLNSTDAFGSNPYAWNNTAPTASVFTVGDDTGVNENTYTYVAYLFATVADVSKVGSYTGTGATQVINCGFTAGARFVLIKAASTTGDWYVWDSARGIVSGNDPYLLINSAAAEVTNTDWVDTAATGFELSNAGGNLANSSGVSYIFLAIA